MAKSTFLELCKAARRACAIAGTGPATVTGQTGEYEKLIEWVVLSDQELQSRWFDWDFLHVSTWSTNTIAGVAEVIAPTDIGTWDEESFYLNYTLSTHRKLPVMLYKDWRSNLRQGAQTNAKPNDIVIKPDLSLVLHKPPDAIYSLSADYWKRPAKLVNNTDTSPIPEEYERIIISRTKMMYAEDGGSGVLLNAASIEYDDLLDKLEAKYRGDQKARRMTTEQIVVRIN